MENLGIIKKKKAVVEMLLGKKMCIKFNYGTLL